MLSKNGEVYSPPDSEYAKLAKNPVFKLANRLIKTNPNPKNRRKDMPRSFSIEPFYTVTDPKTKKSVEVRYYKSVQNKTKGGVNYPEYNPADIEFGNGAEVRPAKSDPDLWWFLYHHPRQVSSPYRDERPVFFYLEDKAELARGKASKSRMANDAMNLIWGSDALDEKEAKRLLQSYNVPNVEDMEDDQVRVDLEKIAKKDPIVFLEKSTGASMTLRAIVQHAVDLKVIKFSDKAKKMGWFYAREDGGLGALIVSVPNTAKQWDTINEFLKVTDKNDNLAYIKSQIALKEDEEGIFKCSECDDFEADSQQKLDKHIVKEHPTGKGKDAEEVTDPEATGELATTES